MDQPRKIFPAGGVRPELLLTVTLAPSAAGVLGIEPVPPFAAYVIEYTAGLHTAYSGVPPVTTGMDAPG